MTEPTDEPVTIKIRDRAAQWVYEDAFDIVSDKPLLARTEEEQNFEVIGVWYTWVWHDTKWCLRHIDLTGVVPNGDGTYGDEVERQYGDMTATSDDERVPPWLIRLAEKRVIRIPAPPEA